jgi:3-isopropylmalate/(R)-2-methylmalate dehydratase small subunit
MKPVRRISGRVAVLDRPDVDTDQIMPKQFLKRIERTGYGEFLFFDWRKDPAFELNRPEYAGATILIAGRNFGCGSSREHAPWGLQDYGFEAIIAPSFGDIFFQNCLKIGLVPVGLAAEDVASLHGEPELTVDVEACEVTTPSGRTFAFELDPFPRECLLNGLDEIGLTLEHDDAIAAYEREHEAPISTLAL